MTKFDKATLREVLVRLCKIEAPSDLDKHKGNLKGIYMGGVDAALWIVSDMEEESK